MSIDECLVPKEDRKWLPLAEGIDIQVLFSSNETGRWTVLIRGQEGASFARHKHYGAGEYYVVKGRMDYRMGSAVEGTYGYEPLGAIHEETTFTEYTELYFSNFGPVLFLDDDDNVISILDNYLLESLQNSELLRG
ncbi:2,4'-dihydroxyacetophenone dioxygenase family protein [Croceicoccus gelatinilyticus]|uniref:2,4'-dihydroxyacetophenone dioxygenase family protein n=1 Tax=Croceicoccus gelatinilyticus TaxID=2835536 RepID=UPI001BCD5397|nr:2,4'-dihydroxyacetophenone dioxygenase family protein [Croceicoccus gelatinilyticus]MBS7668158.1 2,4'-dihydroxyacetophenone dioxygenase family protein [Croceicoccus gelatinilyticus]